MDSGGHQHTLTHGTGQLKDGMAHQTAVLPVQQAVFAPAGGDPEGIAAQLVMEHVTPHTGGVDHGTTFSIGPQPVSTTKWSPSRRICCTCVSKRNSVPLAAAFSARAMVRPKGQRMALVGRTAPPPPV